MRGKKADRINVMISDQDINRIKNALKDDFVTKGEFHDFKDHVIKHMATKDEMLTGFDRILSAIQELRAENAAGFQRMNRHESWIKGIAEHVDYELTDK